MLEAALTTQIGEVSGAFERVLREREALVLRTAYRILGTWADAEDVAQEVFLKLYRRGLGFADDAQLGAWLYRVTVNLCIDAGRKKRPAGEIANQPSLAPGAEAAAMRDQQKERLTEALRRLPVKERAAIVLREIEGLSTAEVAAALGSTEGTVRSQVHKAMAKLREMLAAEGL